MRTITSIRDHFDAHAESRAALVCPGTSLEEIPDLDAALAGYDLRIAVNEALFTVPNADYLTCFDVKAARKTVHAWPPDLPVVCMDWPSAEIQKYGRPNPLIVVPEDVVLTRAEGGSLGKALGFAKWIGVTVLDLYGVDLCRPPHQHYAKAVLGRRNGREQIHEGVGNARRREDGKLIPEHFQRFARQIEMHVEEWKGIEITNMNPWSLLDAFPKRAVEAPPRAP